MHGRLPWQNVQDDGDHAQKLIVMFKTKLLIIYIQKSIQQPGYHIYTFLLYPAVHCGLCRY